MFIVSLPVTTGSGSVLPGHLSDHVGRGPTDELLSDGEEELRGAVHTDPGLSGECGREWRRDDDDEEEEEEEEEGSGGQREEGGERGLLGGRGHVHHRHQLGRRHGEGEQQVRRSKRKREEAVE